jgi:hypothetical protein
MRIQRRLEMAFALMLQDLSAFLIGPLCRLETRKRVALDSFAKPAESIGRRMPEPARSAKVWRSARVAEVCFQ